MRVTITVENGDQDVEVTRTAADVVTGDGGAISNIGPLLDLAADDVRRACGVDTSDGEEVRDMRLKARLSMEEAADGAGISHVTWRRIERGLPVRDSSLTAAVTYLARKSQ